MGFEFDSDERAITQEEVERTRVYDGSFLHVDAVRIKLPDGSETVHETIDHPGAVAVIVIDDEDRILIERQPRTAIGRIATEIPAGKLEPGEDPMECAKRELIEETGYRVESLEHVLSFITAGGYSNEVLHLYMASGISAGESQLEDDEFIALHWMDVDAFIECVLSGEIQDSKTVICGLWLAQSRLRRELDALKV